ncbi:MAG TPA: M48 family metallopeptidase [Candidatus Binatia bacterium]
MIDFHAAAEANRRRSRALVAIVVGLALVVGITCDVLLRSFVGGVPLVSVLALVGMTLAFLVARAFGDAVVLASLGARPLDPSNLEHKQLQNIVHEMAVASGLPLPRVMVIDDPAPNALATGRDPERATIAVTSGLLEKLDRAQTQGVVAHEMAHIGNRDTRLGVLVAVMIGAVALLSDVAWRVRWQPARGASRHGDGRLTPILPLLLVATALAPLAGRLAAFAISRQREYLADATAVELTRNPLALASALEVIAQDRRPTERGTRGTAHLFFVRPHARRVDEREGRFASWWATHPPIAERIARLRAMAYERRDA